MPVDRGTSPHLRVRDVVDDIKIHLIALVCSDQRTGRCAGDGDTAEKVTV